VVIIIVLPVALGFRHKSAMGEKKALRGVGLLLELALTVAAGEGRAWLDMVGVVGFDGNGEFEDVSSLGSVAVLLDLGEPEESRVEAEALIVGRLIGSSSSSASLVKVRMRFLRLGKVCLISSA